MKRKNEEQAKLYGIKILTFALFVALFMIIIYIIAK